MTNYNGTSDASANCYNFCSYRLPCGYCEKTGRVCFVGGLAQQTITYCNDTATTATEGK